ncbi:TPM domain-containing protein [Galbibacter sp. EGI 63066]|uniref:TPM domain-containing protein n=1 Tax=Galbibacter sp. EGI 63066 TaxID=2993559 RepID=UPI002249148C|nr:TPM domain-containing protein [Galbibacter sp. EGI 63066]MCX2679845.1 TPM domain-containing protein [Galbibacter sp. EGI 63066]
MKQIKKLNKSAVLVIVLFLIVSCRSNSHKENAIFSDTINRYNYLDKDHELLYLYDFDSLLTKDERNTLLRKIKNYESKSEITFIILTTDKIGMQGRIIAEDIKRLNQILEKKFGINNLIVFEINVNLRGIGISYNEGLDEKLSDSICNSIILEKIEPKLRKNKPYDGISNGMEELKRILKK